MTDAPITDASSATGKAAADPALRLAGALAPVVAAAAARNGAALDAAAMPALAGSLADALAADPALAHAVNAEPWYRSRVTWGAIVAALAPLAGLVAGHELSPDERSMLIDLATAAGTLAGAGLALYGRWAARVPIGRR